MRLWVGDGNPLSRRAVILLNGVPQRLCVLADDVEGIVERYLPAAQQTGPEWRTETVRGNVRITDPLEAETIHEAYTRCDRG